MAKDASGYALGILNSLAGSSILDKVGLRKFVERMAYTLTKTGFRLISKSARAFKNTNALNKPVRLNQPGMTADLFDLNITEEQQMIRDSVRAFANDVLRPAAASANHALATSTDIRTAAQELGLALFAVPEELGGAASERSTVTSVLVTEDLGYGDMGQAVALLAPIAVANALTQWGTAEQQSRYLPAFVEENAPQACIAVTEPSLLFDPKKLQTTAIRQGDGWLLNGEKSLVPVAAEAELFLVAASTAEGPKIFIVEGGSEGLSLTTAPSMGLRAAELHNLHLDNVKVSDNNLLGAGDIDYQAFVDLGTLGWCALAIGASQAVLDYVVGYANERQAFGEPISHRQAVAFMIADMAIEIDAMRILTWRAACRAEQGKSFQRETYLARTLVKEKAMKIGTDGVQLLGGHGFTHEYPVERWYRDLRAVGVAFGGLHA